MVPGMSDWGGQGLDQGIELNGTEFGETETAVRFMTAGEDQTLSPQPFVFPTPMAPSIVLMSAADIVLPPEPTVYVT